MGPDADIASFEHRRVVRQDQSSMPSLLNNFNGIHLRIVGTMMEVDIELGVISIRTSHNSQLKKLFSAPGVRCT